MMINFNRKLVVIVIGLFAIFSSCKSKSYNAHQLPIKYVAEDVELYNTIIKLDSLFFSAYNSCDRNLENYASYFSDDIEFYHDSGGLLTSKEEIVESTKKYVCGKVTRELIKGSIEVYPIKNFGAVEIGLHKFVNREEPIGTPSKVGKFLIIWEFENLRWKIKRVISLH